MKYILTLLAIGMFMSGCNSKESGGETHTDKNSTENASTKSVSHMQAAKSQGSEGSFKYIKNSTLKSRVLGEDFVQQMKDISKKGQTP